MKYMDVIYVIIFNVNWPCFFLVECRHKVTCISTLSIGVGVVATGMSFVANNYCWYSMCVVCNCRGHIHAHVHVHVQCTSWYMQLYQDVGAALHVGTCMNITLLCSDRQLYSRYGMLVGICSDLMKEGYYTCRRICLSSLKITLSGVGFFHIIVYGHVTFSLLYSF